jgi:hypothetical protein
MTHIMLDLETWGTTPGSDIRSIGAVVFDPSSPAGWIGGYNEGYKDGIGCFYIATDNPAGIWRNGAFEPMMNTKRRKYFLERDPATVKWWNEQSADAQAAFANPVDLRDALWNFGAWLGNVNGGEATNMSDSPLRIWANDPHFDVSILDAAYRVLWLPVPWHYRAPRSMRTAVELAGMTRDEFKQFDTGTAHNALDDAIAQAKIVCECYRRINLRKSTN